MHTLKRRTFQTSIHNFLTTYRQPTGDSHRDTQHIQWPVDRVWWHLTRHTLYYNARFTATIWCSYLQCPMRHANGHHSGHARVFLLDSCICNTAAAVMEVRAENKFFSTAASNLANSYQHVTHVSTKRWVTVFSCLSLIIKTTSVQSSLISSFLPPSPLRWNYFGTYSSKHAVTVEQQLKHISPAKRHFNIYSEVKRARTHDPHAKICTTADIKL